METRQKKRSSASARQEQQKKRPPAKKPAGQRAAAPTATKSRTVRTQAPKKRPAAARVRTPEAPVRQRRPRRPRRPAAVQQEIVLQPVPEVVYTPAKVFNKGQFLVRLAAVVAVVLALSFGVSIFFKVETITVSGTDKYDAWTVKEASGIEIGDNLLSFGEARAAGKIKTALPYVDTVRIGIKLPDTVNIEIKELDVVYAIKDVKDSGEQWWLITSDGRVVEKANADAAGACTQIKGVKLAGPVVGQKAVAYEEQQTVTDPSGETTLVTAVRGSDQLNAALSILQYLEECGIIGQVSYVDVSDLGNLELYYGQRFRVKLGDTTQLLYKIKCMNSVINGEDENNTLKDYDSGVLDISFTIKSDQVIYEADTE